MDNDFVQNFGEFVDRYAVSSEIEVMNDDLKNELRQIEREINCCKPMLQIYRNKYENIETEICDVRQLQRKARFVLDNVRLEEEDLCERFKNIHLNYKACIEKSGYKDPNETIHIKINELTTQKKHLLEELVQLRRKADDNTKKLARVNAMIAEQEKKNMINIQKLKEISENAVSISPDIKKQIDIILKNQEINECDSY
ncbi:PREDICTED: uncharacterized protein YGR130C-like [Acromyrmex echinatior]|uniref:uncharacterized protein YGR130C-like n=1 Tax=Acromyrmex echinatior TaxID=103372 RepID=UPI000580EF53|nr:PREDICTED: uncharacterized protein YGR130C-like [Acromyrmex echinatior]